MSVQKDEFVRKEVIREAVREHYGKLAKSRSCCGDVKAGIDNKNVSSCCDTASQLETELSAAIGYSKEEMSRVPDGANLGLGCGNPVALASLQAGETVIDLGSGGGLDCFLAAAKVGTTGKVIGVDMTPDMVSRARANLEKVEAKNIEFRLGEIEHIPVADNSADVIMSNCVINLSPDKPLVYQDAFRILKSGGRISFSDILATKPVPEEVRKDLALISACVGGAATIDETKEMLKEAGFVDIKIEPKDKSKEMVEMFIPGSNIGEYVVSANIEAAKP